MRGELVDGLWGDALTLLSVVWIDLALAADNAIAVGLAASALPAAQQRRVVAIGVGLALVLRIIFALMTTQLLQFPWLLVVGGLVLFWVAWKMWRDIYGHTSLQAGLEAADAMAQGGPAAVGAKGAKEVTFASALTAIILADVSMSLDNVLTVAAVAKHAPTIMAFGLVLSVVLMGVAATFVAGLIQKHRWIALVGIIVIVFAALRMSWEGLEQVVPGVVPAMPAFLKPPGPH
jgi:YjbE family integral membrane protein